MRFLLTLLTILGLIFPPIGRRTPRVNATTGSWSMTMMGDIMLDRHVRQSITANGQFFPFAKIQSNIKNSGDIVLANLEGPFTTNKTRATSTNLIFTFDPAMAPVLKQAGITMVSLANNHTLNFGQAGLDATRSTLRSAGLDYFGDPKNRAGYTITKTVNGRRIGFVGYHGLTAGLPVVLDEIRRLRPNVDTLIVMPHWGIEYNLKFTGRQQADAHQLIDAGADLVIGSHPHVAEPFEVYNGKFIAYSLGNFIFDQDWSRDTQEGLTLNLTVSGVQLKVQLIPISISHSQVSLLISPRRTAMLKRLADTSLVSPAQHQTIKQGSITVP
ncbi:MAG: CapA family protein [Candidatus Kerfeldbacteria bacterium]|nr:CapA family protein [Candidatus Kerfeldbacteria bacterium]